MFFIGGARINTAVIVYFYFYFFFFNTFILVYIAYIDMYIYF